MTRFAPELPLTLGAASWLLSAQRVAFWPAQRLLVVADAHFGKAATFRARGVPVPHGTTLDNLGRLDVLIARHDPAAILFLGDLFHAREAFARQTVDAIAAWRQRHAARDVVLVQGNHDRAAGAPPQSLGLSIVAEPYRIGAFAFCHHPQRVEDSFVLAGHVHPAVQMFGNANDRLRLPCFWVRDRLMLLPAYGEFTGGMPIQRGPGERVIAIADDHLVELPALRDEAA